jgi:hypothetical protein
VTGFTIWLGLLAAAGLCFPRRPRLAGLLFVVLGVWSIVLRFVSLSSAGPASIGVALGAGVVWFAVGLRQLLKYRDPDARAAHVRQWTAHS